MTNARRLRLFLPLPVLAVAALVWPLSRPDADPPPTADEAAYDSLPEAPEGAVGIGRAGVERSAVEHAAWLQAVPAAEGSDVPCGPENLLVSWEEPPETASHGRYIPPLGPAPTSTTDAVNGIVQCQGSEAYAYMGFQARYADGRWEIQAVPDVGDEDHLDEVAAEPEAPTAAPLGPVTLDGRTFGAAIEGLAAYEPQRTCSGTAKPGTVAMRNMLLRDNAGSRNLGIVRGCGIGGQSEHKEGRAFDWGVNVSSARERAYADTLVQKLLATDQHGNRYALARRMGVMYLIWNRQIWSSYRAADGWRPYGGASPHTDHVHISMSWAGATAKTSFWSGDVVEVLLAAAPTGEHRPAAPPARRRTNLSTDQIAVTSEHRERNVDRTAAEQAWKDARDRKRAEYEAARQAWRERRAASDSERAARREAERAAQSEARARRSAERAARDQARVEARARYEAERQARADRRAADRAARDAARRDAAERAAAERAARPADQRSRHRRSAPPTTVPAPTTTTTAPAATTTIPETTTTTEGA